MNLFVLIMIGELTGILATVLSRSKQSRNILKNILIGTIGSLSGGKISTIFGFIHNSLTIEMAVIGALLLIVIEFGLRFHPIFDMHS
jgi:uncharacterized membrane protein YeaQ/YmgE (transglycosylase-associated protein family)